MKHLNPVASNTQPSARRAFLMCRMRHSTYRSDCSGTDKESASLSWWPSWRATILHSTVSMKAALGPRLLTNTGVSQTSVPDVQDGSEHLPVSLFWARPRACRPVKVAQPEGNEPAQHGQQGSTQTLSPHTHSRQPGVRS